MYRKQKIFLVSFLESHDPDSGIQKTENRISKQKGFSLFISSFPCVSTLMATTEATPNWAAPQQSENDYERVWRMQQEGFVQRARENQCQRVDYNFTVEEQIIPRGKETKANVKVPAVGCIIHRSDSGREDNWIVVARSYAQKTKAPNKLHLKKVYGIDIGIGLADMLPGEPGKAAINMDDDCMLVLTLRWQKNGEGGWEAEFDHYHDKHWSQDYFSLGKYKQSDMGFDK